MKNFFATFLISAILILQTAGATHAAMVYSSETVYMAENRTNLRDAYFFGGTVTIDAPVENDLIAAGGDVTINGDVTGDLMATGGEVVIRSNVGETMRTAGGNVTISGHINRDLLIAGGNVRITKDASISGDVLFAGGNVRIEGPVQGKLYGNGGEVFVNSTINGNIEGNFGQLTLGSNAKVAGDLLYTAEEEATVVDGAEIAGKQEFKPIERQERPTGLAAAFSTASLYKLFVMDIVGSLLFVFLLPVLTKRVLEKAIDSPFNAAGSGLLTLIAMPLLSFILLVLVWLGFASFLLYGLLLILALFFSKLLLGWWVIKWWYARNKTEYVLDWKAAIAGSVLMFVLLLIPIIGWLAACVLYLIALGGLMRLLFAFFNEQRAIESTIQKKKK